MFLELNGVDPTTVTNDDVFDLVMRVASDPIDLNELAHALRAKAAR